MRKLIEQWLNLLWYGQPSMFARVMASPLLALTPITAWVAAKRRSRGFAKRQSDQPPLIVVGNLTAGGSGKTPIVIALVQALQAHGKTPGVVMRGYRSVGRHSDEAALIHATTQAPVVHDENRAEAVNRLLQTRPNINVVVSDDGLQHAGLYRDFEIAVIDGQRGFGNGALLPYGPLREPIDRLSSVQAVIINTGADGKTAEGATAPTNALTQSLSNSLSNLLPAGNVSYSAVQPQWVLQPSTGKSMAFSDGFLPWLAEEKYKQKHKQPPLRVAALAGIGHPERFFNMLHAHGLTHTAIHFDDHHRYSAAELRLPEYDVVLTTAKDLQNFPSDWQDDRFWVVHIQASIDAALVERVLQLVNAQSA